METQKPINTSLITIVAIALIVIVAMICAMGIWMVQRTMTFNEKLLASRFAMASEQTPSAVIPPAKEQPHTSNKADTPPVPATPTPIVAQKPQIMQKPVTPKNKAPQEKQNIAVGIDGRPLDRVTLAVGNDDVDWQF
ncbi:MAG: hypothetical protein RR133_04290 [Kiritimatiellia bacterium]